MSKRSRREVERNERKGLERLAERIKRPADWSKILNKMGYTASANAQLEGETFEFSARTPEDGR